MSYSVSKFHMKICFMLYVEENQLPSMNSLNRQYIEISREHMCSMHASKSVVCVLVICSCVLVLIGLHSPFPVWIFFGVLMDDWTPTCNSIGVCLMLVRDELYFDL